MSGVAGSPECLAVQIFGEGPVAACGVVEVEDPTWTQNALAAVFSFEKTVFIENEIAYMCRTRVDDGAQLTTVKPWGFGAQWPVRLRFERRSQMSTKFGISYSTFISV